MVVHFPSVYDLIGAEGIERVVAAFYRRVATDPSCARCILKKTSARRSGGYAVPDPVLRRSDNILRRAGAPRLRLRHSPFRIDQAARDVWVRHMLAAVDECAIPEPAYSIMRAYFERTATGLINRYDVE